MKILLMILRFMQLLLMLYKSSDIMYAHQKKEKILLNPMLY